MTFELDDEQLRAIGGLYGKSRAPRSTVEAWIASTVTASLQVVVSDHGAESDREVERREEAIGAARLMAREHRAQGSTKPQVVRHLARYLEAQGWAESAAWRDARRVVGEVAPPRPRRRPAVTWRAHYECTSCSRDGATSSGTVEVQAPADAAPDEVQRIARRALIRAFEAEGQTPPVWNAHERWSVELPAQAPPARLPVEEVATWIVRYSIGTYEGAVQVRASEDAEREHVVALAREALRRKAGGSLPFGAERWEVKRA